MVSLGTEELAPKDRTGREQGRPQEGKICAWYKMNFKWSEFSHGECTASRRGEFPIIGQVCTEYLDEYTFQ